MGWGLQILGVLDQADDLLQGTLAGPPQDASFKHPPEIDRSRKGRVTGALCHRGGLPCHVGFIAGTLALDHFEIGRDLLPGCHQYDHAGDELFDGDLFLSSLVHHTGGLGGSAEEGIDRLLGSSHREVLHGPRG